MATKKMDDFQGSMKVDLNPLSFIIDMAIDLKLIVGFVILTLAFIYIPVINDTIVRSALGLVMVLFIPGYALIAALFPRRNTPESIEKIALSSGNKEADNAEKATFLSGNKEIDGIERAALSFGLSIAVSPLIGLGLNYTPWGIRLDPIVVCLTIFTIICVLVANKRRHELLEKERFSIDFAGLYGQFRDETFGGDKTQLDKALTVILIVAILLSVATLAYVIVVPKHGETFTEFYILGPGGKADQYPTQYILGDNKSVTVGVVNHEYRNVTYDLVVALNDSSTVTNLYSEQLTLTDNQTMEQAVNLKPDRAGQNMKMEFLLYADGNMTAPYRECHLWVNVTATE